MLFSVDQLVEQILFDIYSFQIATSLLAPFYQSDHSKMQSHSAPSNKRRKRAYSETDDVSNRIILVTQISQSVNNEFRSIFK